MKAAAATAVLAPGVNMTNRIYFDNVSTTRMRAEVLEAMLPYFREEFGNPSSLHGFGRAPLEALTTARAEVAALIGARPDDIYFTSGATEANNWAINGVMSGSRKQPAGLIVSQIEHHSIMHPAKTWSRHGAAVTFLPVDHTGVVSLEALEQALNDNTALVSITFASNEIGTIEPIRAIAELCHARKAPLHVDGTAAVGQLPINVDDLGIDLMTLTAHQFYGPKGAGALYVRRGSRLLPLLQGGLQENGRRAGTENVPGIVGLGKAAALAQAELAERSERLRGLGKRLREGLSKIEEIHFTGAPQNRLPGHVSFCVAFVEGEALLLMMQARGIAAASGSSCTSRALKASHVLEAIGIDAGLANGSVVLSLGADNTAEEVDCFLEQFPPIVARLRAMSPLGRSSDG